MTILKNPDLFDHPEDADWERVDCIELEQLAKMLARDIRIDLRTRHRSFTQGLRRALRLVAEMERGF